MDVSGIARPENLRFGFTGSTGANTAIHEWGYTEEQLLQQGSWQDAETVRRFYSGTTDDTHSSVRRLHGLE